MRWKKGGCMFDIEDSVDSFNDVRNGIYVDAFVSVCWHLRLHLRAFACICVDVHWRWHAFVMNTGL